jgi:uncharacterized protein
MKNMATIKEDLSRRMKETMKAGDKAQLGYIRNLHSAIRKKEIDDRVDLTDDDVRKIISTSMKQRQDSIEQFEKGGRDDLAVNEKAELEFLKEFMPPELSDEELKKIIDEAVAETGASSAKDMGKVMQALMPKTQGRADGKKVSQLVREKLA